MSTVSAAVSYGLRSSAKFYKIRGIFRDVHELSLKNILYIQRFESKTPLSVSGVFQEVTE